MHEGERLVITNAAYAGGPPPGKPGWMDEDKAARLVKKGSARYADRLSERNPDEWMLVGRAPGHEVGEEAQREELDELRSDLDVVAGDLRGQALGSGD